jgi:hypothetical protein
MLKWNKFAGMSAFINPGVCFAVRGVFASDSGIVGDPIGDFAAALLQEVPTGNAPLFALSSGMSSEVATDTVVNWFEESHLSGRTTLAEALDSSETGIDLTDGSQFVAGCIAMIEETGELVFIVSIASNTATVERGFAGTTPASALISGGFQRITNAQEEGSSKPTAIANVGSPKFNYCQIFRNTWNLTGTAQAIEFYTGSKKAKNRRDASLMHGEDIERALWFGRKTVGVVNSEPFRTMDGLDAQITTNVTPAGSTTDWDDMDAFLRTIFEKNIKGKPNERLAFCGNTALSVVNAIARIEGTIQISVGQTDFGLNVNRWITPYGNVSLITHPMFVESPLWTKDIRILHPGAMKTKWLRRTNEDNYDANGSRAGVDADYGIFTSELSCIYGLEKTGGRLTGLTEGVAVA